MYNLRQIAAYALLSFVVANPVMAQVCPGSQPPSDFCSPAFVLPGTPGLHEVVMNVSLATATGESFCSIPVGHTVWFTVTPTVSGMLTFTTCHPRTTYDTVAQAYRGGDSQCDFMTHVECNDDTQTAACSNGCSAYGSTLRFEVSSGNQYRIEVGSYNNNSAACNLCLGAYLSICDEADLTPPTISITSPVGLSCVCDVIPIVGSVLGSSGDLRHYRLEYVKATGGSWTLITSATTEVELGLLGFWDINSVALSGYYILRLTAEDVCGNDASIATVVWVDKGLESVQLQAPASGQILGGTICADGTVWDNCPANLALLEHRPLGGTFVNFDTLNSPWIINNPLGTWNTLPGTPDGNYEIRLTGQDSCNYVATINRFVTIDNTAPIAVISSPLSCSFVNGVVPIVGSANDANLLRWDLYFSGGDFHHWNLITGSQSPVVNGLLANWNTAGLRSCSYALRLVVTDRAIVNCNDATHNQSEYIAAVNVGRVCDVNGDGLINGLDVQPFVTCVMTGP